MADWQSRQSAGGQGSVEEPPLGWRSRGIPQSRRARRARGDSFGAPPTREQFTTNTPESWTQTTTLSPEQQRALNDQMVIQAGRSQGALQLLNQATGAFQDPVDHSGLPQGATAVDAARLGGRYAPQMLRPGTEYQTEVDLTPMQAASASSGSASVARAREIELQDQLTRTAGEWRQKGQEAALAFQQPLIDRRRAALESQLANMGLTRGSEAWNAELQRDSDQAMRDQLQAFGAGQSEANMLFSQDLASGQFTNQARMNQFQQGATNAGFQNQANIANAGFATQAALANAQMQMQAQAQNNQNALLAAQFGNQARGQQFAQAMAQQGFNNAAQLEAARYGDQQALAQMQAQMQAGGYNQQIRQQQLSEQLARRAQPLNELNALLTGQQVSMPNMPGFNAANRADTTQYMQAAQNQYQAQMDAFNAQQAGLQGMMSGLFNLGGAAMGAGGWGSLFSMGSMREYKEDIVRVGTHDDLGIGIYSWKYSPEFAEKWGHGTHVGVMADELAQVLPDAVYLDEDGHTVVNYEQVWQ